MIRRVVRKLRTLARQSGVGSYKQFISRFDPDGRLDLLTISDCREQLKETYDQYTAEISTAGMSASLELGSFLLAACRVKRFTRLLDLGSGLSSFVFRSYANEIPGVTVFSVDDDEAWLAKTSGFLKMKGVDTANMMNLSRFLSLNEAGFDCILHDLNFVEVRIDHVGDVLARVKAGGLVVFDDVHKPDYHAALLDKLAAEKGAVFSLKAATEDRFGRYSMGYLRPHD
jgi:predicted O-methyltransferase YrrM